MIEATFFGGPHDGKRIALPNAWQAFNVPVAHQDWIRYAGADPLPNEPLTYSVVTMYPELTANGWILRWREPRC